MKAVKDALKELAAKAAVSAGIPLSWWLEIHAIPRTTIYSSRTPNLGTLFKVCEAAGIKPSDFLREVGK